MWRIVLLSVLLSSCVFADEYSQSYVYNESVLVWANKVGPYNNPQETYPYFSLPFCKPPGHDSIHKSDGLGSILSGNELVDSGIHIPFSIDVEPTTYCEETLTEKQASELYNAVLNSYWYQMHIDELPVWGMVGERSGDKNLDAVVFTHQAFTILYNGDRIIEINLTTNNRVVVAPGAKLSFSYSVEWKRTPKLFEDRFQRYLDSGFFEHRVHFLAIFNSMLMVLFLLGLVFLTLMRTVKNDISKYSLEDDELDLERLIDESGWKQVHGDVFRAPPQLSMLSALIGTGHQLVFLCTLVMLLALARSLYMWRGAILSAVVVFYALTSFVAGYSSGGYYKLYGLRSWRKTFLLSSTLYPVIVVSIGVLLDVVAMSYSSTAAIPFTTLLLVFALWLLVSCPLNFAGTWLARSRIRKNDFPCRVTNLPRPIPAGRWFSNPLFVIFAAGILPFGSIFIELYFIFTSFWNYKFYYVFELLLLVFGLLLLATACVNIISTYLMLNAENHRWQWTSFMSGASTGLYTFFYGVYYYSAKTHMTGFFQTFYFFGTLTLISASLALVCGMLIINKTISNMYLGSVAFTASQLFVRRIYHDIKSD